MHMEHFKNDAIKGTQHLPISRGLLEYCVQLARAAAAHTPAAEAMFCSIQTGAMYKEEYFSQICTKALSFDGHHIRATDFRHMVASAWRDFVNTLDAKLCSLSTKQMCAALADLMLTSTSQFDATYDDTNRGRGTQACMSQWAKFREFVEKAHQLKVSEQ